MCSDLVYVILFPQLLMVVHFKKHCNTYGSLAAYIIAFFIRLAGGEALLGLPALIHFPGYDEENQTQLFPFRTLAMLLSLVTLILVSWWTKYVFGLCNINYCSGITINFLIFFFLLRMMFESGKLPPSYDVFRCVVNIPEDVVRVGEPAESGEQVSKSTKIQQI